MNDGDTSPPPVTRAIDRQAAARPDAVALVCGERSVTYGSLVGAARAAGGALREAGISRGAMVGLFADRSAELVVGALGILNLGAAYVPLDPGYPERRLRSMIARAGIDVVVATDPARARAVAAGTRVVPIRGLAADDGSTPPPTDVVSERDVAYVMFTSGSTATPKAVAVEHGSLAAYVEIERSEFGLTSADRVLQFFSPSFDGSAEEIFPCLANGATLVFRTAAMAESAQNFWSECARLGVTVAHLPTSFWHELVEHAASVPESLRLVLLGGERVRRDLVERWRRSVGGRVRLLDVYGATEATIMSTAVDLLERPRATLNPGEAWVGRVLGGSRVHVVDALIRPLEPLQEGEIAIGGPGVARGYFGDPRTTAARFVPDPFSAEPGARLYLTGDAGRVLGDGSLTFAGRLDDQLKVLGHRVEPAEVEAVLREHPDVAGAAVVGREHNANVTLTGYVVAAGAGVDAGDLRRFAQERLPPYMVPAALVVLEALPLTPNRKVDRRALARRAAGEGSERPVVEPAGLTEERIVETWREVLGLSAIDIRDDFFELGGHSLQLMQVLARVRERFDVSLSAATLYEARTPAALARAVDAAPPARRTGTRSAARADRTAPLTPGQRRIWVLNHVNAASRAAYTVPFARRLRGPLDIDALATAVAAVAARHDALRTSFAFVGRELVQRVDSVAGVELGHFDVSGRAEPDVQREVDERARVDFDLERAPLARVSLLRHDERDHVLLVVAHHLVFDGWSIRIFEDDLGRAYRALREGREPSFPPLTASYGDHAAAIAATEGDAAERNLDYWRRVLEGAPPALPLGRRTRPTTASFRGGRAFRKIPAAPVAAAARRHATTPYTVLAAALATLLSSWLDREDVVVGSSAGTRPTPALEHVIGYFVDVILLRFAVHSRVSFEELLREAHAQVVESFAHGDVPLERLLGPGDATARLAERPLTQVTLAYEAAPQPRLRLPGVDVQPYRIDNRTAKFDLTFEIDHHPDAIEIALEFNGDVFQPSEAEELLARYADTVAAAAGAPRLPLAELRRAAKGLRGAAA